MLRLLRLRPVGAELQGVTVLAASRTPNTRLMSAGLHEGRRRIGVLTPKKKSHLICHYPHLLLQLLLSTLDLPLHLMSPLRLVRKCRKSGRRFNT